MKFYSIDALYKLGSYGKINKDNEVVWISSISLSYIEDNSSRIYQKLIDLDKENKLKVIFFKNSFLSNFFKFETKELETINDYGTSIKHKDLSCAIALDRTLYPDEVIFVTSSLEMKYLSNLYFGEDSIEFIT